MDFATAPVEWLARGTVIKKGLYLEDLKLQPVKQGKGLVCVLHASGQQQEAFRNAILIGNQGNLFPGGKLPVIELLCDEPTQWDSMYVMLNCLQMLRPVRLYFI